MRRRTLSDEGVKLFLNGMTTKPSSNSLRQFVWNLFHTDYDESLESVVMECRESSKALAAEFGSERFTKLLESAVTQTVKIIITRDQRKMSRKQMNKNIKFFIDVMRMSFDRQDYQTAHLILFAITHQVFMKIKPRMQKWAPEKIKEIKKFLGGPTFARHIKFWTSVRSDYPLPSLFAFCHYIERSRWQGKLYEMNEALDMINIFQYLEHTEVSQIYKQGMVTKFELEQLSKFLIKK